MAEQPMADRPMLGGMGLMGLVLDKPHRCPDCYSASTVRLWPPRVPARFAYSWWMPAWLRRRGALKWGGWAVHWCRPCGLLWGGRRVMPPELAECRQFLDAANRAKEG